MYDNMIYLYTFVKERNVNIDSNEYFCRINQHILGVSPLCGVHVCCVEKTGEKIWWSLGVGVFGLEHILNGGIICMCFAPYNGT